MEEIWVVLFTGMGRLLPGDGNVVDRIDLVGFKRVVDRYLPPANNAGKGMGGLVHLGDPDQEFPGLACRDFLLYVGEPFVLLIPKLNKGNIDKALIDRFSAGQLLGSMDFILLALIIFQSQAIKPSQYQVDQGGLGVIVLKGEAHLDLAGSGITGSLAVGDLDGISRLGICGLLGTSAQRYQAKRGRQQNA